MNPPRPVIERLRTIRLLLLDVDGILTDGSIWYTDGGDELKRFHVRDGLAIKIWQQSGREVAILSGRKSATVTRRAQELGITLVFQGHQDKMQGVCEIEQKTGLAKEQFAAMGDDLPDVPVMRRVGVALSVADACEEARHVADYVTIAPGGAGAVREAVEWQLKQLGEWAALLPR